MKKCNKCQTEKELFEFHKRSNRKCGIKSVCKSCESIANKRIYVENNHKEKSKHRYHNDIEHKLRHNLRARLKTAIKKSYKNGSAVSDLGCSIEELKLYLEKQFKPGMSWDNYGEWHIDHIKPLSAYNLTIEEQVKEVCHHTNLQPLWATDNLSKGNK